MSGVKRQNPEEDDSESVYSGRDTPSPLDASQMSLAFNAHPEMLEEDGKPKSKMARRASADSKKIRNDCEKQRRDRLNAYIGELARLVPVITGATRKMDKSSILRLTVNYLRVNHDLIKRTAGESTKVWRPDFPEYNNLGSVLLESLDVFMMVISRKGILNFATEAITRLLGHKLVDILGNPIFSIIHPDDYEIMLKQLMTGEDEDSEYGEYEGQAASASDESLHDHGHRSFYIRMLNMHNRQVAKYETMLVEGVVKRVPPVHSSMPQCVVTADLMDSESVLVGIAKLVDQRPVRDLYPTLDPDAKQWYTRHELTGQITYSDPRGAWLTGFQPKESMGFSPYQLLHKDDISAVVAAHNTFLTAGCTPDTVFRMYTKSRDILFIRTNTRLITDMWTSKPKFIISIQQVMEPDEGEEQLAEQRARLQALTDATATLSLGDDTSGDNAGDNNIIKTPMVWRKEALDAMHTKQVPSPASDQDSGIDLVIVEESDEQVIIDTGDSKYPIDLSGEKLKRTPLKAAVAVDSSLETEGGKVSLVPPRFIGDQDDDTPTCTTSPQPCQPPNILSSDFSPGSAPQAFRNLTMTSPQATKMSSESTRQQIKEFPSPTTEASVAGSRTYRMGARRSHGMGPSRVLVGHTGEMDPEKRKQNPLLFGLLSKNPGVAGDGRSHTNASCVPHLYSSGSGTRNASMSSETDSESPLAECGSPREPLLSPQDLANQAVMASPSLSQMYQQQQQQLQSDSVVPEMQQSLPGSSHINLPNPDLDQDFLDMAYQSPPGSQMGTSPSDAYTMWQRDRRSSSLSSQSSSIVGQSSPGAPGLPSLGLGDVGQQQMLHPYQQSATGEANHVYYLSGMQASQRQQRQQQQQPPQQQQQQQQQQQYSMPSVCPSSLDPSFNMGSMDMQFAPSAGVPIPRLGDSLFQTGLGQYLDNGNTLSASYPEAYGSATVTHGSTNPAVGTQYNGQVGLPTQHNGINRSVPGLVGEPQGKANCQVLPCAQGLNSRTELGQGDYTDPWGEYTGPWP